MKIPPFLLFPVLLAACGPCAASLIVGETFGYNANSGLAGQNGGIGWAGAWTHDGETAVVYHDGLGYSDASGNKLVVSGGNIDTAAAATSRNLRQIAGDPLNGVWLSFLFHLPAANSKFEGVTFYRGASPIFAVSNSSTSTGPNITLNNHAASQNAGVTTSAGAFGQTFFIVLRLIEGGGSGGNDRIEMFVNPPLTEDPTVPTASIQAASYRFDTIRVAAQDGASLMVDEIRIGHQYEDVSPHIAAQDVDSDGDGLTDAQEIALGLDPTVSDAGLILAIRQNPGFFGLYDRAGILALHQGGAIHEGSGGQAAITFEIQRSTDLVTWPHVEAVRRSVPLAPGKNFLRLSLDGTQP